MCVFAEQTQEDPEDETVPNKRFPVDPDLFHLFILSFMLKFELCR